MEFNEIQRDWESYMETPIQKLWERLKKQGVEARWENPIKSGVRFFESIDEDTREVPESNHYELVFSREGQELRRDCLRDRELKNFLTMEVRNVSMILKREKINF